LCDQTGPNMSSTETSSHLHHASTKGKRWFVPAVFTLTIFVSASLLFFVQPLFAKLVLPQIGGAPGVWTTAMLFFQVVLLGGYIYAHLLTHYVPLKWQLPIHLAVWAVALWFLPLSVSESWAYDPTASTVWQTLTLFALGVGVPFGMLSANAPLLQSWYAKSDGPSSHDPYFLYGASNFGSLLALLGFPLLAEPLFGAQAIGWGWAAGFVAFGALLMLSAGLTLRARPAQPTKAGDHSAKSPSKITTSDVATWLFLAFVPSTLMLSITTKISTDLGSFPLIWVVPLSLYILSFVITFSNRPLFSNAVTRPLAAGSIAVMAVLMSHQTGGIQTWLSALMFAPALFIVAVHAHRSLYERRPDAEHLTLFYITMSVGGALGGLFNSIIAPVVFNGIYEGVISVILAALLLTLGARTIPVRPLAYGLLCAAAVLFAFSMLRGSDTEGTFALFASLGLMAVFAIALAKLGRTPVAILVAVVVFLGADMLSLTKDYTFKDRSFFGAHTVYDKDGLRVYGNGTTIHGYQYVNETGTRPTPLSYYHADSPMAQVLTTTDGIETARIGIVGLGVGSLACYAQPGQSWEFYEIDEMVDRVARSPEMFNFMSHCAPGSKTHLGDARIVLEQQDLTFDIMVLDAYSSDSIPVHLVTREAVEMYLDRLTPSGVLVFHISNRYYDLTQPLARIADKTGLLAAKRVDAPDSAAPLPQGAKPSVVMMLTANADKMDALLRDPRWQRVQSDGGTAWTDDHAHLLSALK
jgi:spermidine synthase